MTQNLHNFQIDGCNSILEGKDTIVITPTGMGKTWLFLLPLIVQPDGIAIVVMPLRALRLDQCAQLVSYSSKPESRTYHYSLRVTEMKIKAIFFSGDLKK